jgi:predicted nuclease of predicted toxin-antitoxin system
MDCAALQTGRLVLQTQVKFLVDNQLPAAVGWPAGVANHLALHVLDVDLAAARDEAIWDCVSLTRWY